LAASRAKLLAQGLPEACTAELASPDWSGVDADLSWLAQDGNHLLQLGETGYPDLLSEIASPPPLLFVRGDATLLGDPQLAMVGTRNPTPGGRETAHAFAAHLARCGLAITSGLALGIDAESHRGALAAGGRTIAVMGTGLDRIYPARHRQLAHEIAESGALVSEFPLGTRVLPGNFPRRNRLIAGLSVGTLVTEAAVGSGSLITARLAVDQGREVFAIPGSIHNPMSRGCHVLIRQGAKLVETADDVLEELAAVVQGLLAASEAPESDPAARAGGQPLPEHARLLELMGYDPVSVDTLVQRSRLTPAEVSSMLLIMELQGLVAATPGGFYLRTGPASSPERESPQ
jgi:DNA processing protein